MCLLICLSLRGTDICLFNLLIFSCLLIYLFVFLSDCIIFPCLFLSMSGYLSVSLSLLYLMSIYSFYVSSSFSLCLSFCLQVRKQNYKQNDPERKFIVYHLHISLKRNRMAFNPNFYRIQYHIRAFTCCI